ncbi:MAG: oligoendopeptidase F [Acidobacteria bacterium RIFCSPLOWO2_12_FULL_65_11]|nr:MAG: oligoendopeptidase F [Acidobacteria bacterium RIFCSPLOWO2_02_FULL_64_15]OFW31584.1 MAG: oligoendopeptidase F [Acidobacteria bacterium RIFCSPLOWO2_12_FULL_65_11]
MTRLTSRSGVVALVLVALTLTAVAQERDRTKIPDTYKWNLADIYPSEAAWRAAKDKITAELPQLRQFQGKLATSAATLADALEKMSAFDKELSRQYVYASMLSDQDTRDAQHQGMRQEMSQLYSSFGAQAAFIEPEVLRFERGTVDRFLAAEPRLRTYRFYLQDIVRRAAHTLTDSEEKLLADLGPLAESPSGVYGILANADFPFPTVTLSDGRSVKLDQAAFADLRALPTRADREKVMSSFFGALGSYGRTFGTTMNGEVQKVLFFSKARKYPTALELALDGPNIPVSVYSRLIDGVNRNLPAFHRYLRLRKRMMGVDELHYYDLYAPLVGSVNLQYTPEEAQKHVLAAVAPLGSEYGAVIQRAFNERWIDLFPNDGKRSGAYSQGGAYDVHPYMLINYNSKYNDVSTLAHELGHTMQSYLSNKTQPYPLSNYPIFVAEVASTFNESLLIDYMLANIRDDDTRLSLLGNYLEGIKATVFRQTQFAEFELRMHEMAQKGQPITGDALAKLYLDITKKYYGHDQGVSVVDAYIAHEWSYIPHFYRDFYVYQYATSFSASLALAEKVKAGDAAAKQRYLTFLNAGGSKYPIDLLKDAGVDMTTDEPLDLTIKAMNRVMDEMETLLARRTR